MPATIRPGPPLEDYAAPIQLELGPREPFPCIELTSPLDRRWLHYVFLSRDNELAIVANFAWTGPDPDRPKDSGRNTAIMAVYKRGEGWRASQYNCQVYVPLWSAFRQPNPFGKLQPFRMESVNEALSVRLEVQRTCRPCAYQTEVFCGESLADVQRFRWQAEPGVFAQGDWEVAGQKFLGVKALGYHDRTGGYWSWPGLGGWVWGFVNEPAVDQPDGSPPRTSLTISLIQPDRPAGATNGSIMLWREGRVCRHFPRRDISFAARGELDRDHVVQVPHMVNLFNVPPMAPIPRLLAGVARMGDDVVSVAFQCEEAMRIVVPNETGTVPFSVHEVLGTYQVEGRYKGQKFAFEARGIVEFAGGADGE